VPPFPEAADANATVRDRLTMHRTSPTCNTCHSIMDPIGFGMENFDSSGKYQTMDNGKAVDSTGEIDKMSFTNLETLGAVIKKLPDGNFTRAPRTHGHHPRQRRSIARRNPQRRQQGRPAAREPPRAFVGLVEPPSEPENPTWLRQRDSPPHCSSGRLAAGIGVAVPLPRLLGMLNGNGTAYAADGAPLPIRFGTWFFGNGIIPERWVPARTGQGSAWTLSEQLAPLQEVKPWLSVITGCAVKLPDIAPHASMPTAAITGGNVMGPTVQLPSVDQVVAKITGAGTLPYVAFNVGSGTAARRHVDRHADLVFRTERPNPPDFSPANLFKKLVMFANTGMMERAASHRSRPLRRNKVLDAERGLQRSARSTRHGGSASPRCASQRIKQIQLQIQRASGPKVVGQARRSREGVPEPRGRRDDHARARTGVRRPLGVRDVTDLTRVFSFMFTCASHAKLLDCGLDNSTFHEDYGHRLSSKGQAYATAGFNTASASRCRASTTSCRA
jgi:hypothetical protein